MSDPSTGLIDCGNWTESASWTVPAGATSGVYVGKRTRADMGGASHVLFVVRDDAAQSDLVFQTSDATCQAYNQYGGNSLSATAPVPDRLGPLVDCVLRRRRSGGVAHHVDRRDHAADREGRHAERQPLNSDRRQ